MKFQKIVFLALTIILLSCGSSERVITEDGKVYELKGKKFYNNGNNVTDELSSEEKESITAILEKRLEAEQIIEEKQEVFEDKKESLEETIKEAEKKQKELEKKQEQLEDKLKQKEDARQDFLKAKERLQDEKDTYEKLKEQGKLSPSDEEKWKSRFAELEKYLKEANQALNDLK